MLVRTRNVKDDLPVSDGEEPSLSHVQVEIIDSGAGMDEETKKRCLEPFFTTKGERGTGLGLAHGVRSCAATQRRTGNRGTPGKGTTMRLIFLASAPVIGQPAKSLAPAPLSRRLRVLIADDDPVLLKSLCDTLETDGHVISKANGGQAAIDLFHSAHSNHKKDEAFDIVITDLGMPYVDGRKVSSAIKVLSPSTPVLLLTGWGQRLVAEGDVPPHVDRVLNKPPKLRELREALADFGGKGAFRGRVSVQLA